MSTEDTNNIESEEVVTEETTSDEVGEPVHTHLSAPIIALLALALVGLLGLLYVWFISLQTPAPAPAPVAERPTAEQNNEPESTTAEAQAGSFRVTSNSDEISAIEADLESTNLEELDAELNAIDAELEAALQ